MFCSTRPLPLDWPKGTKSPERFREITGTYDFKWPQGSKIVVAFERPPVGTEAEFEKGRALVLAAAKAWTAPLEGRAPGIAFDFETVKTLIDGPSTKSAVRYDVLVSLAPLPRAARPDSALPEELVLLPRAQLGSYARRVDYGVPTAFLGRPATSKEEHYFESAEGRACVVHELGHILGLAHEHQNPLTRKWLEATPWRTPREIVTIVKANTGLDVDESFVEAQITGAWPISNTGEFSEWRIDEPIVGADQLPDLRSAMANPMYRCFLAAGPRQFDPTWFKVEPDVRDLEFLHRLYPPAAPPAGRRSQKG